MAGAEKSKKMFEKLFDRALSEMRQRHEKLNAQVGQWVARAEEGLGLEATLKNVSGRMEQLHKTQLETMNQWQKEFEQRFQQMLDLQKQMVEALVPEALKPFTRVPGMGPAKPVQAAEGVKVTGRVSPVAGSPVTGSPTAGTSVGGRAKRAKAAGPRKRTAKKAVDAGKVAAESAAPQPPTKPVKATRRRKASATAAPVAIESAAGNTASSEEKN